MPLTDSQKKIVAAASHRVASAGTLDPDEYNTLDAEELIAFAKAYRDLGHAVAEQLDDLFEGERGFEEVNPNAVDLIARELSGYSEEIDDVISEYEKWRDEVEGFDDDEDDAPEMVSSYKPRRRR